MREEEAKEMSGEGATARGVMEKGGCVRVIKGEERSEEMTQLNTSSLWGLEALLESQRG